MPGGMFRSISDNAPESVVSNQNPKRMMSQMNLKKPSPITLQCPPAPSFEMREEGSRSELIPTASVSDAPSDEQREMAEDESQSLTTSGSGPNTVPRDPSSAFKSREKKKKNKFGISLTLGLKKSGSNILLKKSVSSTSSSSTLSITRKQVNGSSKNGKFIKTSSTPRTDINTPVDWKSPGERANMSKQRSFAFKGSQAHDTSGVTTGSLRNNNARKRSMTPESLSRMDGTASLQASRVSSISSELSPTGTISLGKSVKNRPGTPPPRQGLSYDFASEPDLDSNTPPPSPIPRTAAKEELRPKSATLSVGGDKGASVDAFQTREKSPLVIVCATALDIIGGIGNIVQDCFQRIEKFGEKNNIGPFMTGEDTEDNGYKIEPMNTFEEELMDEIDRLDRMNSWDTHGTFTTVNTFGTAATGTTLATVETGAGTLNTKENDGLLLTEEHALNPTIRINSTTKKVTKKKKKRVKRRKAVNFQYPPISSMKECPRISEDERKKLFFTEEELDEYEHDRRHNLCDDIEVVAVEFTDSESDSSDDEIDVDNSAAGGASLPRSTHENESRSSSLRTGKYSKSSTAGTDSVASTTVSNDNATNSSNASKKSSRLSPGYKKKSSNSGKIKGVQIYLRQRSVKPTRSKR